MLEEPTIFNFRKPTSSEMVSIFRRFSAISNFFRNLIKDTVQ